MRRRQPRVSEVRRSIRAAVEENPGIHFRGLSRAARVTSAGQLRHHLDKLERDGDIVEVEDGRYRRFFVAGQHDAKVRAEMARFAREVPRRIARLLLESPMNRTQLRRNLRCADSTLGYHLSRMVMLGDLARLRGPQSCVYSLTREDDVRRMLLAQGAADGADDRFAPAAGSWENGPPEHERRESLRSVPEPPSGGFGPADGLGISRPEPEPFGRFAGPPGSDAEALQPQRNGHDEDRGDRGGDRGDRGDGGEGDGGAGRGPFQE